AYTSAEPESGRGREPSTALVLATTASHSYGHGLRERWGDAPQNRGGITTWEAYAGEPTTRHLTERLHPQRSLYLGLRVEVSLLRRYHPGRHFDRNSLRDRPSARYIYRPAFVFCPSIKIPVHSGYWRCLRLAFPRHASAGAGVHPLFAVSLSQLIQTPA